MSQSPLLVSTSHRLPLLLGLLHLHCLLHLLLDLCLGLIDLLQGLRVLLNRGVYRLGSVHRSRHFFKRRMEIALNRKRIRTICAEHDMIHLL